MFVTGRLAADPAAASLAADVARAAGCAIEAADEIVDGPTLRTFLDELSDLYRGETIVMVTSLDLIAEALRRRDLPAEPVAVAIDSAGWTVLDPSAGQA